MSFDIHLWKNSNLINLFARRFLVLFLLLSVTVIRADKISLLLQATFGKFSILATFWISHLRQRLKSWGDRIPTSSCAAGGLGIPAGSGGRTRGSILWICDCLSFWAHSLLCCFTLQLWTCVLSLFLYVSCNLFVAALSILLYLYSTQHAAPGKPGIMI